MSERTASSKIKVLSGANLRIFAFEENAGGVAESQASMLGRGTGMNHVDDFGTFPVLELGKDGVEETVQGQHSGSFTLQKLFGLNQYALNHLPLHDEVRPSHLNLPKYTFRRIIAFGEHKGVIYDEFRHCTIRSTDGTVSPQGVMSGTIRVLYHYHNEDPGNVLIPTTVVEDIPEP